MPRLLLIAGSGRNSGKTTLACSIISKFNKNYPIIGIKISPHFHKMGQNDEIVIRRDDLIVIAESVPAGSKDSSRMLAAGARKSFFIMTDRNKVGNALGEILPLITDKDFIVCESGGLRNFVKPGLFLLIKNSNEKEIKPEFEKMKKLSDRLIHFDGQNMDLNPDFIMISENRWKLNDFIP